MNFYELLFNRGQPSGEGMTHFERLFAAKLVGGGEIKELEGVPPLLFKANGEPLIDWSIYGNTVQSATPTPQNPIMPQGTGERTGNLFDVSTWHGVTATRGNVEEVENGFRITALSNDAYTNTYSSGNPQCSYKVLSGETYTLSWEVDNPNIYGIVYVFSGETVGNNVLTNVVASQKKVSFTVPSGHNYIAFRLGVSSSGNSITYSNIMLNTGATALPYEPYGYKIPISSANTTTPVYLGEVQTVRAIKKLVLTGEENFNTDTYLRFSTFIDDIKTSTSRTGRSYCSHYECLYHAEPYDNNWNNVYYQSGGTLYFHDRRFDTVTAFKSYLAAQYAAGTPVTVWYVLAEPTTGIVNEPLMKIDDYADTLSKSQAGVSIPTNNGSTTIDVDTTLKPSEVYIKYMG